MIECPMKWPRSVEYLKKIYYNLDTKDYGILSESPCRTYTIGKGIQNDITGVSSFGGGQYYSSGLLARIIPRWIIDGYVEAECIEEVSKKFPEIMKRYKDVFCADKLEQNPVIELIYLKHRK